MKENIIRICMVCGLLIILVSQFAFATTNSNGLSNEMLAWGFRRGLEHSQPDLDSRKFKCFETIQWFCYGKFRIKKCLSYI